MNPRIERATPRDLAAVLSLLDSCGLPTKDVGEHFRHFVVARVTDAVCGVGGLEVHGHYALLRSVAVLPESRGAGVARAICNDLLGAAREHGVRRVYLLTTTAEPFFARLGFRSASRDTLPAPIRATREFAELCPQTAVAMSMTLASG